MTIQSSATVKAPLPLSRTSAGLWWGLTGVVAFSLTVPLTRVAVGELSPLFIGSGRAVVAAVLAGAALAATRQSLPARAQWLRIAVVAAGVVVGFPILTSYALTVTPASHGAVVIALLPAATAVVAVLRVGERPPGAFWLFSAAGAVAAAGFALLHGGGLGDLGWADLLLFGAVLAAAVGYAEGGLLAREIGAWQTVSWALVVASPLMLTLTSVAVARQPPSGTAVEWACFGYLSAVSMYLGFFAWYHGLAIGPMARVSQVQLVQPIMTISWAALLLGEQVGWLTFAGGLVVIACAGGAVRARARAGRVEIEHHTSIRWQTGSLGECAEFRRLDSAPTGRPIRHRVPGCRRASTPPYATDSSRSEPKMDTDSYLLEVRDVVAETADATSIVFDVPDDAVDAFAYTPGQFLTVGVPSEQTGLVARCYSICTPPGEPLTVTVKRTVDGYASNWLADNLRPGDTLRVLPPSGIFSPKDWTADLLLFAGGSGVTPIMSIVRTAMAQHSNRVVLFYANRDETSVIFASALAELAAAHPERLQVFYWLESVQGEPSEDQLREFAAAYTSWTSFCCGPAPYMLPVSNSLRALDFPRDRRHQEKFVSLGGNPFGDVEEVLAAQASVAAADDADESDETPPLGPSGPVKVEVELDGEEHVFDDWQPGEKLLDFLESKGVKAPYSCREGECSACAIRLLSGEVRMLHNDVLEQEDLDEGLRLGCQSVPASEDPVKISYS